MKLMEFLVNTCSLSLRWGRHATSFYSVSVTRQAWDFFFQLVGIVVFFLLFFSPFSEFSVVPFGTMVGFPSRRGNILSSCILVAVLWFWLERGVCQNGSSPFKSLVVKPIVIYYPWLSSRRNLPSFPQIFGVSDLCPWAVSPFPFALFF